MPTQYSSRYSGSTIDVSQKENTSSFDSGLAPQEPTSSPRDPASPARWRKRAGTLLRLTCQACKGDSLIFKTPLCKLRVRWEKELWFEPCGASQAITPRSTSYISCLSRKDKDRCVRPCRQPDVAGLVVRLRPPCGLVGVRALSCA